MSAKIALVGCGLISAGNHVPAIIKSSKAELVALVDLDIEIAESVKRKYGLQCSCYQDTSQLTDLVDGFIIATPNHTHFSVAKKILEAGKPVLIEKPITNTSTEAKKLIDLANQNETFISVGYKMRHHPNTQIIQRIIELEQFGKVIRFDYAFGTQGGWAPVSGYNMDKSKSGGGVLMVSGTHFIDRMLYWFGSPKSFNYFDDSYGGVEGNCNIALEFDTNNCSFKGNIKLSKSMVLKNRMLLETEFAYCVLSEKNTESVTIYPKNERDFSYEVTSMSLSSNDEKDYFQQQIDVFVENILGTSDVVVDGNFALQSIELIENMYEQRQQLAEPWSYRAVTGGDADEE